MSEKEPFSDTVQSLARCLSLGWAARGENGTIMGTAKLAEGCGVPECRFFCDLPVQSNIPSFHGSSPTAMGWPVPVPLYFQVSRLTLWLVPAGPFQDEGALGVAVQFLLCSCSSQPTWGTGSLADLVLCC